ncbi:hypothetical protein F4823DRAFT_425495 [Ustulina deusta]|nr:hypothetical protein F4823DRAFT_425495 [Ustulina deusta]
MYVILSGRESRAAADKIMNSVSHIQRALAYLPYLATLAPAPYPCPGDSIPASCGLCEFYLRRIAFSPYVDTTIPAARIPTESERRLRPFRHPPSSYPGNHIAGITRLVVGIVWAELTPGLPAAAVPRRPIMRQRVGMSQSPRRAYHGARSSRLRHPSGFILQPMPWALHWPPALYTVRPAKLAICCRALGLGSGMVCFFWP